MDRRATTFLGHQAARRLGLGLGLVLLGGWLGAAQADSLVGALATTAPAVSASTVPARGDLNPYGVAFVPEDFKKGGPASPGDVLIANFNGPGNAQGTGATVVRITPSGGLSTFYQGPNRLGLSTALGVLKRGFVLVGNVPSTDGLGMCTTGPNGQELGVGQGSLLVLDRHGHLVKELTSAEFLDGPWDLTLRDDGDRAQVFVSNVLNGTVSRIDLALGGDEEEGEGRHHEGGSQFRVLGMTRIASGYQHHCDPAAFVVGPTGLALDADQDLLYVASTADNAIFAIRAPLHRHSDAGHGELVTADSVHLHGPVGMVLAPNGDIITTQGDAINPDPLHPSEIVEHTPTGQFVAEFSIDPGAGAAFGMAIERRDDGVRFAAVDDGLNVLDIWNFGGDQAGDHRVVRKAGMIASQTHLTPSSVSVQSGTAISLTAAVSGSSPTGNVSFYDGTTLLGSMALSSSASATISNVVLLVGMHNLTAVYAGDANNSTSTSAAVTVTVTTCTYGCGGMGGGGGGGYGGGAFGTAELALLLIGAGVRRLRRTVRARD